MSVNNNMNIEQNTNISDVMEQYEHRHDGDDERRRRGGGHTLVVRFSLVWESNAGLTTNALTKTDKWFLMCPALTSCPLFFLFTDPINLAVNWSTI